MLNYQTNIRLHFAEVKGPVFDRLQASKLMTHLSGRIYLTHFQAIQDLAPEISKSLSII